MLAVDDTERLYVSIVGDGTYYADEGSSVLTSISQTLSYGDLVAGGRTAATLRGAGTSLATLRTSWLTSPLFVPFATQIAIDDFGAVYLNQPGGISRLRPGIGVPVESVGGPAQTIYAGGDVLYATNSMGEVWRRELTTAGWSRAGSAGAEFAVDTFGVLYGLSTDGSAVYRNNGGESWTSVGGAARGLAASHRLFAKSPANDDVYTLRVAGWAMVANCQRYAVGGRSLACARQLASGNFVVERYIEPD